MILKSNGKFCFTQVYFRNRRDRCLLAVLLITVMMTINVQQVFAGADGTMNFTIPPSTQLIPGDTFDITVRIDGEAVFNSMALTAQIPKGLELTHWAFANPGTPLWESLLGIFNTFYPEGRALEVNADGLFTPAVIGPSPVRVAGAGVGNINAPTDAEFFILRFRVSYNAPVGSLNDITLAFEGHYGGGVFVPMPPTANAPSPYLNRIADITMTNAGIVGAVTVQRNLMNFTHENSILASFGTPFVNLNLPQAVLNFGDGIPTYNAGVAWYEGSFNPYLLGPQMVHGTVILPSYVLQNNMPVSLDTSIIVDVRQELPINIRIPKTATSASIPLTANFSINIIGIN